MMVQINGNQLCSARVVKSKGWRFLSTLPPVKSLIVIILVVQEINFVVQEQW